MAITCIITDLLVASYTSSVSLPLGSSRLYFGLLHELNMHTCNLIWGNSTALSKSLPRSKHITPDGYVYKCAYKEEGRDEGRGGGKVDVGKETGTLYHPITSSLACRVIKSAQNNPSAVSQGWQAGHHRRVQDRTIVSTNQEWYKVTTVRQWADMNIS